MDLCILTIADAAATMGQTTAGAWPAIGAAAATALLIKLTSRPKSPLIPALDQSETLRSLLEFTNSIQGAGQADQIFRALTQSLRLELKLAGIALLASDADAVPSVSIAAHWPQDLLRAESAADVDHALCPCLRQNLPRQFNPEGSPVRCGIDRLFRLGSEHAAYCIPFSIGLRRQYLVHMLLPIDHQWTEDLRQLAQAYVNTASSSLMSLQLLKDAQQRSMTDPLTQLYNRHSMEQLLQREVALAERHDLPLSLVMIDMDHFKQINDTFGHAAGDHVLKALADCVRMTLRKTDLAFRMGGDEFVIALPQTHAGQAQQVVGKLRQAFAAVDFSSAIANMDRVPTLSVGLAERNRKDNVLSLEALMNASDQALYDAKRHNRNCVRVFHGDQAA